MDRFVIWNFAMGLQLLKQMVDPFPAAKKQLVKLKYRAEAQHVRARHSSGAGRSPMLFTSQKCASTFLEKALREIATRNMWKYLNLEGYYWQSYSGDLAQNLKQDAAWLWQKDNALFGPIRDFTPAPNLTKRPIILMLRDPRDVMVSAYYSIAFSHSHPANQTEHRAFQTRRNRARQLGLTGYLSVAAREYIPKYATFAAQLLPHSNVTFLTYEDMHGDFHTWSRRFLSGLGVAEDPDLLADIANLYQKGQPKADNPRAHRRQGRPGDFERKLDAQGQDFLNQTTQQIRDQFGTWQN